MQPLPQMRIHHNSQAAVISDVRTVITMDREDLTYDDKVKKVRKETNDWVAKYRRDNSFSGRPSFGCVA